MADCSWLAGTRWYVPAENLLAYLTDPALRRHTAAADQTLWAIASASDGRFEGTSETRLWRPTPTAELIPLGTSTNALSGVVEESGEVTGERGEGRMAWTAVQGGPAIGSARPDPGGRDP